MLDISNVMIDSDKIFSLFLSSPSLRLIRHPKAPIIIAFFYSVFKTNSITTILEEDLIDALISLMENNDIAEIEDTDVIEKLYDYETKAKRYLSVWQQPENNFVRSYEDVDNQTVYELTLHSENVIQWLEKLDTQEFVGTESRFKDIFNKVRELIEQTTEDPKKRIKELESRKKEIEDEIRNIRMTDSVETYDDYQIKDRIHGITLSAKELISDFKEVESNFKEITRGIYQKHTDPSQTKGNILFYTFNALDSLKESDQGKSFYAFWNFLISQNRQDEWKDLMNVLFTILDERGIDYDGSFLKRMKTFLFHAGEKVNASNDRLSNKLSKIISEKELSERIKIKESINIIKDLALKFAETGKIPKLKNYSIEHRPDINMPMEKSLTFYPKEDTRFIPKINIQNRVLDEQTASEIGKIKVIDKERLVRNINNVLKDYSQVSLKQVIEKHPIQEGLSEVLTYINLADKNNKGLFNASNKEVILFDAEENKYIEIPKIIFSR